MVKIVKLVINLFRKGSFENSVVNPRHACAVKVQYLVCLCVCLSVSLSVCQRLFFVYRLQGGLLKMAIFMKLLLSGVMALNVSEKANNANQWLTLMSICLNKCLKVLGGIVADPALPLMIH